MSSNYRYPGDAPFQQPSAQSSRYDLEDKQPYDDFSDTYSSPFGKPQQHQTFNVDPQQAIGSGDHQRRPSYPLNMVGKHSYDMSLDHDHPAYPPTAPPQQEPEVVSFWRKWLPDSLACRLFILTVVVETIIDLAIEGELLLRVHEETKSQVEATVTERFMSAYLTLFAMAHIFQFVMAVHALSTRNTLQFMFLIVLNALFLLAAVVQIREVQEIKDEIQQLRGATSLPINVLTTSLPIIISLAEVAYIALGWKIYNEFGWQVFKFLGADRRIKKMYAKYQIYECLVKFDVFFFAAFSILFIWLVLNKAEFEFYITCAALPLSLILLVEGHLAAKHENKLMMITFMFGCVGAMVYFVYKLVKVLLFKASDPAFRVSWKTLTVFAVLAIMLLFATFVLSIILMQNFGRGLKEALIRKDNQQAPVHRRNQSTNLNRMSID